MSTEIESTPDPLLDVAESSIEKGVAEGTSLHVSNLTRNVKADHLKEIFSHFGLVKNVDLQADRKLNLSKGFAYVEFSSAQDAEKAQAYMDDGQLDGNKLKVTFVLVSKKNRQPSPEIQRGARAEQQIDRRRSRSRSPVGYRRRSRSPGRGRGGGRGQYSGARGGGRRLPSPVRRRSPGRGRSRSRSPRRRGVSPRGAARRDDYRERHAPPTNNAPRRRSRSISRSRSVERRRRSPSPRRRARSESASPPRRRGRRSSSNSSYSSSSSSSGSSSSSSSSTSSSSSRSKKSSAAKSNRSSRSASSRPRRR